jgi:methyl-accepting chemotaxis protein
MNLIQKFMIKTRLRTKILLITAVIVAVVMFVNLIYNLKTQKEIATSQVTDFSNRLLEKTFSGFIYPMERGDTEAVKREIEETAKKLGGVRIFICGPDKNVRFASEDEFAGKTIEEHLLTKGARKALVSTLMEQSGDGKKNGGEDEDSKSIKKTFIEYDGQGKYLNIGKAKPEKDSEGEKAGKAKAEGEDKADDEEDKAEKTQTEDSGTGEEAAPAELSLSDRFFNKIKDITVGHPYQATIRTIARQDSCMHCHGSRRKTALGAMVLHQPMDTVYWELFKSGTEQAIIYLFFLVVLIGCLYLFFNSVVTKRLQQLQEKTAQVADGDVSVEIMDYSCDSIGRLTRNFNTMITSIRDRIEYANSLKLGISDPFFMVDPQGRVTFVNQAALTMLGRGQEEVLGRPCQEVFLTPDFRDHCPMCKALASGVPSMGRRVTIAGKSRNIPAMCSAALLKDSQGAVLGGFQIMRDMTIEVEAENQIRAAYAREETAKQVLEMKVVELSEVLAKVSHGDFSMRGMPAGDNATMDVLTTRVNETLDAMVNLIMQSKKAITPVINGVLRISRENQNLAQRTEQQAAAMEEISATLEELVSNTSENLSSVRHADALSKEAVKVAHEGGEHVGRTAKAMSEMAAASHKVVEMMDLINEITFQTNLLSINAAVEAARAGEQGRGFAVVANEVRNLAKRSASASKDIQSLVREIMEKVTTGRQWVGELEDCFTKIIKTSGHVSDALGEVTMGSEEMSRGIEQINLGTQEVCEVNEKNASFVDELSQETQKLKEKARQLQEITDLFILGSKEAAGKDAHRQETPPPGGKDDAEMEEEDALFPPKRERRSVARATRPLREDLVHKGALEEMSEDLLDKELEEGFEEF